MQQKFHSHIVVKLYFYIDGLVLDSVAGLEARNGQPSTKFDTRLNAQLTTESAFLPNAYYGLGFFYFCLTAREYFNNKGAIG